MSRISDFTNNNFRVLAYLYDNRNTSDCTEVSTETISKKLELPNKRVAETLKQLENNGYITFDALDNDKCQLTIEGIAAIEVFRNAEYERWTPPHLKNPEKEYVPDGYYFEVGF